jgi:ADP-ribosylglycohydrolase
MEESVGKKEQAESMVWASFAGDALALGAHWEYDPAKLAQAHGRMETFQTPRPGAYHEGKHTGDFTHYGDQTLILLESLASRGGFDLEDFFTRWQALFSDYKGYLDGATRQTLDIIAFGEGPGSSGSHSTDLAGASRIAPLLLMYVDDPDGLVAAAVAQTKMTHNNALVLDSAAFFARAAWLALCGASPIEAMREAAGADYPSAPIAKWVEAGIDSAGEDTIAAIGVFGRTCKVSEAFPGTVHVVAKYENALAAGLTECVMAGGDSAARAMLAGMLLAAPQGADIPEGWISGLTRQKAIADLMEKL